MTENNKNNYIDKTIKPSVRPSFSKTKNFVKNQIDYDGLRLKYPTNGTLDEIVLILTECYLLPENSFKKINGDILPIKFVREIYTELTAGHVELVTLNFSAVFTKVKNIKAYLQTALYNSVFELDSHYSNLANYDLL